VTSADGTAVLVAPAAISAAPDGNVPPNAPAPRSRARGGPAQFTTVSCEAGGGQVQMNETFVGPPPCVSVRLFSALPRRWKASLSPCSDAGLCRVANRLSERTGAQKDRVSGRRRSNCVNLRDRLVGLFRPLRSAGADPAPPATANLPNVAASNGNRVSVNVAVVCPKRSRAEMRFAPRARIGEFADKGCVSVMGCGIGVASAARDRWLARYAPNSPAIDPGPSVGGRVSEC